MNTAALVKLVKSLYFYIKADNDLSTVCPCVKRIKTSIWLPNMLNFYSKHLNNLLYLSKNIDS